MSGSAGGERDLARLLADLQPRLHERPHVYRRWTQADLPTGDWLALVNEAEGVFAILAAPEGDWARISLGAYSSLQAVGLTAALAARLAVLGISANVVAGHAHDHILVPWSRRHEALAALATKPVDS